MIGMSVVMPLYRAKFIAWLCFESLIRQRDIDFEWELVIMEEENDESVGYSLISSSVEKLQNVGCIKVSYWSLKDWVPLAHKIKLLTDKCSVDSKIWTMAAADHYYPPLRLKTCYNAFKNDIDWYITQKLLHYDILTGELVVRRISPRGSGCKAVRMSIAKQIEDESTRWRGVDGWFYRACTKVKGSELLTFVDNSDNWKYGISTYGFHNISFGRGDKIKNKTSKFMSCDIALSEIVPPEILGRLIESRNDLANHTIDIPDSVADRDYDFLDF